MRSNYGESFISAVLDRDDLYAFDRYGITPEVLATRTEKLAYEFISDYAQENEGRLPDYRTLEAEVDGFVYIPQTSDSFRYMAEQIKEYHGKKQINDFWGSDEIAVMFDTMKTEQFAEEVVKRIEHIRQSAMSSERIGFDLSRDTDVIVEEYKRRKEGKSFKTFESAFPKITEATGKYQTSNVYVWYGRSGRGKSVITMIEAIYSALQGATVLIWSLEMAFYELATRMLSAISAMKEMFNYEVNGEVMPAGFDTMGIMTGTLDADMESEFMAFVKQLNDVIPGRIVVRSIDEPTFTRRNVRALEADIKTFDADVVVVDPIYYMDMEENTSRTAGGDVAKTSQALRLMTGRMGVVMHVITQAEEVADDTDEMGERELRLPKRSELKKAKQILEDSSYTFAIDTCGGRGLIGMGKGRNGGEDMSVEILYLPQFGIVKEISSEFANDMFESVGDVAQF